MLPQVFQQRSFAHELGDEKYLVSAVLILDDEAEQPNQVLVLQGPEIKVAIAYFILSTLANKAFYTLTIDTEVLCDCILRTGEKLKERATAIFLRVKQKCRYKVTSSVNKFSIEITQTKFYSCYFESYKASEDVLP